MNSKLELFKTLRYACLLSVIVLGLATIVGTGGSDDNDNEGGNRGGGSSGNLNYQGSTTPLTKLYFEHFGSFNGDNIIDLILAPVAVNRNDDFVPDGRYVYL